MEKHRKTKSFAALLVTQFLGAFNDNVFRIAMGLLVTKWILDPVNQNKWVSASGFTFAIPFILFSLGAGRLADRFSKTVIIRATKWFELFVVMVAIYGMVSQHLWLMLAGLFLIATQSAFFGPSKFGILPELMPTRDLSMANGYMSVFTQVAILAGSITATQFSNSTTTLAIIMVSVSIIGLASSHFIGKEPAMNQSQKISFNFPWDFFQNWNLIRKNKILRRSIVAMSWFWFAGGVIQLNAIVYNQNMLNTPDTFVGVILFVVVLGVVIGSLLAGKLSKDKVEMGLVPIGGLGMSLFTLDLCFSYVSKTRTLFDVGMAGLFSAFFIIPLQTLVQERSPDADRGRIISLSNFLSFVAITLASAFLWLMGTAFELDAGKVFLALGILSLIVTSIICASIPQAPVRLILYGVTNLFYRIRVVGRENIPVQGPALLVPNHVSYIDPFLICASISRIPRFLMYRSFYENKFIHPFVKLMGAIPISAQDNPKEIMRSLKKAREELEMGHLACIFPEGMLSRVGGTTLGFQKGVEIILKGIDVPVIPVHLEGVWGSIFSWKGGKAFWKWPRKIPYPITVTFGEALKKPTTEKIRQAVLDLGAEAFKTHHGQEPALFRSFLKEAKSTPNQKVASDSTGRQITNFQLLTGATLFKNQLFGKLNSDPHVGVLIPPSVGGLVANVGLAADGRVPINLNYTLDVATLESICQRAEIKKIITSRKLIEKLKWPNSERYIYIEDVFKEIKPVEKVWTAIQLRLIPRYILTRTLFKNAHRNLDDLATIMFTSGSTGDPKGVMLTEGNILSNIRALSMILQLGPKDTLLGVLPFFHSFGYTASMWFPIIHGFKVAYHSNPLDTKIIGKLCREEKVSFLVGTPTFLTAYLRKIAKEDFSYLRFAVAGAEKLRPELAHSFEEKYGVPVLEGYGCTELSPVVALNLPDFLHGENFQIGRKVGKIGRPIPGVSAKIVDPDTFERKSDGEPGLLLIKGPNIMKGYLNDPAKTAEVIKEGWYVTGDIAAIDSDGFIEITDRISRFSKIGGEMVPHLKIEEKLQELSGATERQFIVTSVPDERRGEALVVLVSGFYGSLDEIHKQLAGSGLPNLWVPNRNHFFTIPEIPLLGTGKLDMQSLKKIAAEKMALEN